MRQRHSLHLVVCNVDRRDPELVLHVFQLGAHIAAQLGVEVGERLIHQECGGAADHGAGKRDPLALSAGQLAGKALEKQLQLHLPRDVLDRRVDLRLRSATNCQRIGDVGEHRHMRIESVGLEDHRDVTVLRQHLGDVAFANQDAAGAHLFQTCDHTQRSRLAGAGSAKKDEKFAVLDFEVEALDDVDRAERFVDVLEPDLHRPTPTP